MTKQQAKQIIKGFKKRGLSFKKESLILEFLMDESISNDKKKTMFYLMINYLENKDKGKN